jgi:immune inhibitor A
MNRRVGKTTKPPLSMAGGGWTGITLEIKGNPGDEQMTLDVKIEP